MRIYKYFLFFCFIQFSAGAACQKYEDKLVKYKGQLKDLKERHCYFPETQERKPCMKTELGKEVKIRKIATQSLLSACETKNNLN